MLAMAIGVFAVSYTWTWTASQQDQATFQIGTDLRVQPGRQLGIEAALGPGPRLCRRARRDRPGTVERESVSLPGVAQAQALALDASAAPALVHLRPDLSAAPVAELMAPLAAARPSLEAVRLPGEPRALRLAVDLKIGQVERSESTRRRRRSCSSRPRRASSPAGGGWTSVVVRDARGLLHRFEGQRTTVDGGPHEMVVPLGPEADAAEATFAYPLDLLAIELLIRIPEQYQVPNARVTVGGLASPTRPIAPETSWQPVPLAPPTAGGARSPTSAGRPTESSPNTGGQAIVAEVGQPGIPALLGRPSSAAGPSCASHPPRSPRWPTRRSRSWRATPSSRRPPARSVTRSV